MKKSQEWFEKKVQDYHHGLVDILSEYMGSEKPIDLVYHCTIHGDTYTTINAKNVCKSYFLPCKKCQSIRKSQSAKKSDKKNKQFYYDRLVKYCKERGGKVLETEWTRAKDIYHFKCGNPNCNNELRHNLKASFSDDMSKVHCCISCAQSDPNYQAQLRVRNKAKYGVEWANQTDIAKLHASQAALSMSKSAKRRKLEKCRKTCK